jgi:hypothetical protein
LARARGLGPRGRRFESSVPDTASIIYSSTISLRLRKVHFFGQNLYATLIIMETGELPLVDRRDESKSSEGVGGKESLGGLKTYEVGMHTFKKLNIAAEDKTAYILRTVRRIGCDAALLWRINPTGSEEILMTHYPPNEMTQHLEAIKQFSSVGDGETKAVLLTAGREAADWSRRLAEGIEEVSGVAPDMVRLTDEGTVNFEDSLQLMQKDKLAYQLCAARGKERSIFIPTQGGSYAYDERFGKSSST